MGKIRRMNSFTPTLISQPTRAALSATRQDYELMLITILRLMVDRFERNGDYPFIDMKLSILSGEDFVELADASRDFKGRSAIYGWTQGRGLESLSGHAEWLASCSVQNPAQNSTLATRVRRMVEIVFDQMERMRATNGGHVSFLMNPDGRPFTVGDDRRRQPIQLQPGQFSGTDLFYVKGAAAAAKLLRRGEQLEEACNRFETITRAVENETLRSDQAYFDPNNRPIQQPGKFYQGGRMLCLGGVALFAHATGDSKWLDIGERMMRQVLARHVNHGRTPGLQQHDFYEATDAAGAPWIDDGKIVCDPGHACEWVGLAAKVLLVMRDWPTKTDRWQKLIQDCQVELPAILTQNFANGHNAQVNGICKTYDLMGRQPINSDLPWWNLPETLRAAVEVAELYPDSATEMYDIAAKCSNGFLQHFVRPELHMLAYQNLNAQGKPIDVIPGTADADAGYHTGLSIIDFLKWI